MTTINCIPVYLINLDKDLDRKAHSLKELKQANLLDDLVHCGAIYGRDLTASQLSSIYDKSANLRRYPKILGPGQIGCYQSHIECWKKIVASAEPMAMVIEDDIAISSTICSLIEKIRESCIQFDMIKLIGRKKESPLRQTSLTATRNLIEYFSVPSYTGAYLISRQGAEKLLKARIPFFRPIDVDLRYPWEISSNFTLYGIYPYPVTHAEFATVLGARPPSPHGRIKYRYLKLKMQIHYTTRLLLFILKKFIK